MINSRPKILIVDDNDDIRTVTTLILESLGYEVESASCGDDAITLIINEPSSINVVMVDVFMPGLSGVRTVKSIRLIRPDMPIIMISGNFDDDTLQFISDIDAERLEKPYSRDELLGVLHRAIPT